MFKPSGSNTTLPANGSVTAVVDTAAIDVLVEVVEVVDPTVLAGAVMAGRTLDSVERDVFG